MVKKPDLLLISVAITIVGVQNFTTCKEDEAQVRNRKFREKYCGKGYTPWEKMQNADNNTLANICWTFFSYKDKSDEGASEAKKMIKYSAIYDRGEEVVLDIIHCKVRYRNFVHQFVGEATFYFAEGSDEDTAYKFCMVAALANKTKIILSGVMQHLWNQTIAPNVNLGSVSTLDLES